MLAARMHVRVAVALLLVACGSGTSSAPEPTRERVALVPQVASSDLDLLFVFQDSVGGLELQTNYRNAFPAVLAELTTRGELPSVHIGATSTDLGTQGALDAAPGPTFGWCSGVGRNAALRNNGTLVQGAFISDVRNADGTRTSNYSGSLATAFDSIASLGAGGCGFEQMFEAAKRALDGHPANVGFLRPEAALAIIMIGDEDDCSIAHSTLLGSDVVTLGPLASFRCTRFGVQCDIDGVTTDDMAEVGFKHGCHWREDSAYLTTKARYTSFFAGLKADPRNVLLASIAGPPTPFEVELRTPPGGGTAVPGLAHSCTWNDASGPGVADPSVRRHELMQEHPRGTFELVCGDLTPMAVSIAREIRGLLGDACLTRDIAMPADCAVFDERPSSKARILECDANRSVDCYQLVEDPACTTSQHLRIEVTRSAPPAADSMLAVRCVL